MSRIGAVGAARGRCASPSLAGVSASTPRPGRGGTRQEPVRRQEAAGRAKPANPSASIRKGCFAGGVAIATDGPTWQAMRLSRNRRWGHPTMIKLIEKLSRDAVADGWPGLLLGDISQPRGGPMLTGHASHQIGLDADIWLTPMPDRRLSASERETMSAVSMIKKKAH